MKELAPEPHEQLDHELIQRDFELIKDDFEFHPEGPIFSAIWQNDINITDLTKRKTPTSTELKAIKEAERKAEKDGVAFETPVFKPVITSGLGLVAEIMIQTGALHTADEISEINRQRDVLMKARNHEFSAPEQKLFEQLDKTARMNDKVKRAIAIAYDTYFSDAFWADPVKKTGLKTDELEALYDMTENYENQGLLRALREVEQSGSFTADIMSEANRIGRILVAKEINAIA